MIVIITARASQSCSIAVLGPGGVGGFIAGALEHAGRPVTVVARPLTAMKIRSEGLKIRSVRLGEFVVWPQVVTHLRDPVDVLLVTTKAGGLEEALERVYARPGLIVPLLNGLDHLALLRQHFDNVVAGTVHIEADRLRPGKIVQTSPFMYIDVASDRQDLQKPLRGFADLMNSMDLPVRVHPSEMEAMWSKLVMLNALACTTSAADRPIGFIRSDPQWRPVLVGCVEEAVSVANAEGADLSVEATLDWFDNVAHASLGSSMQRDISAGRTSELEMIPGAVLRAGARHGIECPTIHRLVSDIRRRIEATPESGKTAVRNGRAVLR